VEPVRHQTPRLEDEQQHPSVPPAIPPRRNPPRDWAAPPPWTGESPDGLAGAPERVQPDGAASYGSYPRDEPGPASPADVPAVPPARESAPAGWGDESRGLAGSAAYRLAGPDPDELYPAAPAPGDPYEYPPVAARRNPEPDPARQAPASRPPSARPTAGSPQATPQESASQASSPGRRQDAAELFGPAWERPRKYEAYPTLRTRIGLPSIGGIPKLGMAALALVLAAMVLFFFGPMILGFGKNDPGTGGTPTAAPSAEATETPAPTEPPAPTPQLYTVKQGDTISKIAKKFNVTVEALLAANPQIKNPDKIKIGDKITIPLEVEGASEEP
jgi:nucleoid-associated protein YgaU